MAKGDSAKPATPSQTKPEEQPQQNQTLQGNPSTDANAQTAWMNPADKSDNSGVNGGKPNQQATNQPISNGTMLGQITAGNQGQYVSGAWNMDKFNDPNKHDPKYDIGRILSKYPPGQEGLQAARNELQSAGYNVVGKDKIQGPAGIIDVGMSFSDPNAQHSWQWNPVVDTYNQANPQQNSMLGQQPGNQNQFMEQMFRQLQARRGMLANQQFNPIGGSSPDSQMTGQQQPSIMMGQTGGGYGQPNSNGGFLQSWLQQMQQMQPAPSGPQVPYTTRNGQQVPANPGDMISNGWGGYKPYDPNDMSIN